MANTSLFSNLKKLFSTNVIIHNVGGKLKVMDIDANQAYADLSTNFMKLRFPGFYSSFGRYGYNEMSTISTQRPILFRDYELMESDTIIASALDIYADETTVKSEFGNVLEIRSDNDKVKKVLDNLFYDVLNIEFNAWPWVRMMCKYGDAFLKLEIAENYGVVNVIPLSPYELEREEGFDTQNPFLIRFKSNSIYSSANAKSEYYENYEIVHFRLLGDSNFLPYGKCLSGNTVIDTEIGPKLIKDIEVGDIVSTWDTVNNKVIKSKVLDTVMSGIKKTYEIKTAHRKIYATYEHPILISTGEYKTVKDLTLDDHLILPTDINITEINYPKLKLDSIYTTTVPIDEQVLKNNFKEFIRFYGFMLGDGWLCKNKVAFSIGDRLDKSQKYIDFIKKLGLSYRIEKENTSSATCIINSTYLQNLLEQLEFVTGSLNKKIPSWIWCLPNEYRLEMLFGFADADGCDIDDNTFQLGTINESLIDDLRSIAMRGGLSTTKKWTTHSNINYDATWDGKYDSKPMFLFTYKFVSRDFKKVNENYHIEKIRGISEQIKEEVYDIQVDSEFHNFIANGIVVHNSMIESARRVWKQLQLMEDAMLIHRIMRAPDKRVFKIDVGNIAPNDIDQYMASIVNKMKKTPYVDPRTGDYNLKYNIMNMTEDFYIPVRGGDSGTSIDQLTGLEYNAIDDIEYLRNKMMAGLKIPKSFLGYEEGIGKATLAAEDVRFARTIERIQRIFCAELSKIAVLHLYAQGFSDAEVSNFELSMTSPSTIYEQEKVALWSEKIGLIRDAKETEMVSSGWMYKNILNLSEAEANVERDGVSDDLKEFFRREQIKNEGNDPYKTGQSFGTPYDMALLQQGKKDDSVDFGKTNFKVDYDRSIEDSEKDPDSWKRDKSGNLPWRDRETPSKYGQDSHIRGRDPLGRHDYVSSYDIDKVLVPKSRKQSINNGIQIKTSELIFESLTGRYFEPNKTNKITIDDIILDKDPDNKTFLDENNLLND
jgi:intein/homing endonuclease